MANSAMALSVSVDVFTEADFTAAFNEWARRTREDPDGMAFHMDQCLKSNNNDEGKACTGLIFSILHDLKRSKNEHV